MYVLVPQALNACGQILHKNLGKGQTPPFRQCLDFGSFWSLHPSLTSVEHSSKATCLAAMVFLEISQYF